MADWPLNDTPSGWAGWAAHNQLWRWLFLGRFKRTTWRLPNKYDRKLQPLTCCMLHDDCEEDGDSFTEKHSDRHVPAQTLPKHDNLGGRLTLGAALMKSSGGFSSESNTGTVFEFKNNRGKWTLSFDSGILLASVYKLTLRTNKRNVEYFPDFPTYLTSAKVLRCVVSALSNTEESRIQAQRLTWQSSLKGTFLIQRRRDRGGLSARRERKCSVCCAEYTMAPVILINPTPSTSQPPHISKQSSIKKDPAPSTISKGKASKKRRVKTFLPGCSVSISRRRRETQSQTIPFLFLHAGLSRRK